MTTPSRIGLVDGDYLIYRTAFSLQKKSVVVQQTVNKAKQKLDSTLRSWKIASGSDSIAVFLTGKNNFRIKAATFQKYKDRASSKPLFYKVLKDHLIEEHFATYEDDLEADDLMSISQYHLNKKHGHDAGKSVIITCDKDLLMVPGMHYNPLKRTLKGVEPGSGLAFFYKQLLTGDTVDTIPGIHGIGSAKAESLLKSSKNPSEMLHRVLRKFHEELMKDSSKSAFHGYGYTTYRVIAELGTLLWMLDDTRVHFGNGVFDDQLRSLEKDYDMSFINEKGTIL